MTADHLSLTFAALADPTRRSILTHLAEREASVNELAEPFPVSKPAISRHLKVLERAGLIVRSREAHPRRGGRGGADRAAGRPVRRGRGVDAIAQAHLGGPHGPARRAPAPEGRAR